VGQLIRSNASGVLRLGGRPRASEVGWVMVSSALSRASRSVSSSARRGRRRCTLGGLQPALCPYHAYRRPS
jgi:hypothetical protein